MSVKIANTRLAYVPVPKIACTSVKMAILRHNAPADYAALKAGEIDGDGKGVHGFYPTVPMSLSQMLTKPPTRRWFGIVRDPLKRFVSGYRNRILHHKDLRATSVAELEAAGLPLEPDIDLFAANLAAYSALNRSTRHHFAPICTYMGRHPRMFHRVFCISEIADLASYMAEHGGPSDLPHEQTGGPKMTVADLSPASIAALRDFYARDYAVWGRFILEGDGTS